MLIRRVFAPIESGVSTDTRPTRRKKLSEVVLERLLDRVNGQELAPGDPLPSERELMVELEVGRPAIREAMQGLQRMGLIEIRHGGRARVAEPSIGRMIEQMAQTMQHVLTHSPASLEHLKEARAIFDMEMARIAARRRTAADVGRLWRLLEQQQAARRDPPEFVALDGALHREIAGISGNPILPAVSEAMFAWLSIFHVDLVRYAGAEELTLTEHEGIVRAIEAGDAEQAARATSDHLNRASALYRQKETGADLKGAHD